MKILSQISEKCKRKKTFFLIKNRYPVKSVRDFGRAEKSVAPLGLEMAIDS